MTRPYTYLLKHNPTNTFYYGVRWADRCDPEEFWTTYFTSSLSIVPLLRTLFGDDSFEFEIRKTFSSKELAQYWESKVLRRMKVLKNKNVWMNRTTNRSISNDFAHRWTGKKRPEHADAMRKRFSDKSKNPMFGKTHSDEARRKISEASVGNKYKLGVRESFETRKKKSLSRLGKSRQYRADGSFYMG